MHIVLKFVCFELTTLAILINYLQELSNFLIDFYVSDFSVFILKINQEVPLGLVLQTCRVSFYLFSKVFMCNVIAALHFTSTRGSRYCIIKSHFCFNSCVTLYTFYNGLNWIGVSRF